MIILHIDSSITGETSVSRQLAGATVAKLTAARSDAKVRYRDLVATPMDHYVMADKPDNETQGSAFSASILDEFLMADTVVIGAPLYNFTVSSQLKAWIDRIVIGGATFRMDASGAVGLVGHKRVIVLLARGAVYQPGTPWAPFEHAETFLTAVFGFMGIKPEFIIAEGTAFGDESRSHAISNAKQAIESLASLEA
ncbi:hypothetical protein BKM77_15110 [Pseudomonas syringae]|uniref:FMN-dependent NADH-azoreductase n=1 Tax=Pseudomonas syringae TaxID=317 RepID=UPI000CDA6A97|nr:NAD(P)H-dependent oxidoreductase [Pseudomonas syringae]POP83785.1 FMN-dependent NADH-azoreductase [Pseudomonas syringae]RXF63917.1 hypothetical protein BKM77_15110 [Pseudomonas syringae]